MHQNAIFPRFVMRPNFVVLLWPAKPSRPGRQIQTRKFSSQTNISIIDLILAILKMISASGGFFETQLVSNIVATSETFVILVCRCKRK